MICGVGINDFGKPVVVNGRMIKEYDLWKSMITRCYSTHSHIRRHKYQNCTVSENFKSFLYFYNWCQIQKGFNNPGWQLDKDILLKGNNIYHEELCVFVPPEINSLLLKCDSSRGSYPIGVTFWSNKFIAQCSTKKHGHVYLGSYLTSEEAFNAYKIYKESAIKECANEFKNLLDERVYVSLCNYYVSFHD